MTWVMVIVLVCYLDMVCPLHREEIVKPEKDRATCLFDAAQMNALTKMSTPQPETYAFCRQQEWRG